MVSSPDHFTLMTKKGINLIPSPSCLNCDTIPQTVHLLFIFTLVYKASVYPACSMYFYLSPQQFYNML